MELYEKVVPPEDCNEGNVANDKDVNLVSKKKWSRNKSKEEGEVVRGKNIYEKVLLARRDVEVLIKKDEEVALAFIKRREENPAEQLDSIPAVEMGQVLNYMLNTNKSWLLETLGNYILLGSYEDNPALRWKMQIFLVTYEHIKPSLINLNCRYDTVMDCFKLNVDVNGNQLERIRDNTAVEVDRVELKRIRHNLAVAVMSHSKLQGFSQETRQCAEK